MTIAEMYHRAPCESNYFDDFQYEFDGRSYICDVITDIASDRASGAGYREIDEILTDYTEDVNRVIDEFGWDGVSNSISVAATYVLGERFRDELYEDYRDDILLCAIHFLEDNFEYEDYPEELYGEIEDACENLDTGDRMDEISDMIRDWIEENMGDGEFDDETELNDILGVA